MCGGLLGALHAGKRSGGAGEKQASRRSDRRPSPPLPNPPQTEADPIIAFLSDEAAVASLRPDKAANAASLHARGITQAHVDALYDYAKFQYECGNYGAASDLLAHFAALSMEGGKVLASLWGRLACLILTQAWDGAADALARVRDAVDADARAPALAQLQRRAWVAHWALFVHFNVDGGAAGLLDLMLTDRYLHAIQAVAPHLLRYAAAAAVVSRRRRGALRDVAHACEAEAHAHSDPVTEFVRRLACAHDVDGAAASLAPALNTLSSDFFVAALAPDFAAAARVLLFEQACRVHCRLDLASFADTLGVPAEEAEAWAAGLARGAARLDARVDARAGAIVVGGAFSSVHDALVDTVKGLTQRTLVLANAVGAGAAR